MRHVFRFVECLFGSRYRPADFSSEFLHSAAGDGYFFARAKAFFCRQQIRRAP
jgi:hypothetical protein